MTFFLNQMRVNVCEHMTRMASLEYLKGATRGLQEEWMEENLSDRLHNWYLIHLESPIKTGRESENSYQKLKRSRWTGTRTHTQKQNRNISMDMAVFLNQKRANVCEHTTKMASLEFLKGATRGLQEEWMEGNLHDNDGVTRVFERCHQGVARGMDGGKLTRQSWHH